MGLEGSGVGCREVDSGLDSGGAVLEGLEFRSIKFSVWGCFDAGCAVVEDRGSEADECGSLAVAEP